MSPVTKQSLRFQAALASIKLIQASVVLDLTEDDFNFFFFSSRRRHTSCLSDWSSDVCSSDLGSPVPVCSSVGARWPPDRLIARSRGSRRSSAPTGPLPLPAPADRWRRPDARESPGRSEERRVGKEGGLTGWQ